MSRRVLALYPLESVRTPVLMARLWPAARKFSVMGGAERWWAALAFDGERERAAWDRALENVLFYETADVRMWGALVLHVHGMPRDAAVEAVA